MTSLTPIETRYRGHRFRSRLEARWAVAFDAMGVEWLYEPEGFRLPSGRMYLPDFRLRLTDGVLWAEIKPDGGETSAFEEFMGAQDNCRGAVLRGIPKVTASGWLDDYCDACIWAGDETLCDDAPYGFCACSFCGAVDFKYDGRSRRIQCCAVNIASDDRSTLPHPIIRGAFDAARSARFEHGESGEPKAGFQRIGDVLGSRSWRQNVSPDQSWRRK